MPQYRLALHYLSSHTLWRTLLLHHLGGHALQRILLLYHLGSRTLRRAYFSYLLSHPAFLVTFSPPPPYNHYHYTATDLGVAICHTLNISGWIFGNRNVSHGLRLVYRDRATDTVGMLGSRRPTLQHRNETEGITRSREPRSRNTSGVVSFQRLSPLQRNNTTSRQLLYCRRRPGDPRRYGCGTPIVRRYKRSCYHSHPHIWHPIMTRDLWALPA
jgi:hypothetical protein